MMWSHLCYFSLICFLSPLKELNDGNKACQFYSSDDVNRKSIILDITKRDLVLSEAEICIRPEPFHTLLAHGIENEGPNYGELNHFYFPRSEIDVENIIIVNQVLPKIIFKSPNRYMENKAKSLTVVNTKIDIHWGWLDSFVFKHVRFEKVSISTSLSPDKDLSILTDHLQTLTFLNGEGLDPWHDLNYDLAGKLRQLTINGYKIPAIRSKNGNTSFQNLWKIDLQTNGIETIDSEVFSKMPMLKEINLGNNGLRIINFSFGSGIKMLNLEGNLLKGDETTCKFLQEATYVRFRQKTTICPALRHLQGDL
ncbi:uncharacterized protein LOC141849949 [Brevipalpus obovatus]|uniref:uncharacterized protein LOC141849949 n=1 Tax=Brevipalpus obovatus TaxID=246614 RepID=UPI003D9F742C